MFVRTAKGMCRFVTNLATGTLCISRFREVTSTVDFGYAKLLKGQHLEKV